jgi:hypothetical protein
LHRWFIPAIRPGSAIDSTHITFSEVFSIFFMQHWGIDIPDDRWLLFRFGFFR